MPAALEGWLQVASRGYKAAQVRRRGRTEDTLSRPEDTAFVTRLALRPVWLRRCAERVSGSMLPLTQSLRAGQRDYPGRDGVRV